MGGDRQGLQGRPRGGDREAGSSNQAAGAAKAAVTLLLAQRYRRLPAMLREMRESAGLTQRELAKKLGINHTMVHNSETAEHRVDVAEFIDWAIACGRDPMEAFGEFLRRRR